jgi:hypothetical protein
MRLKGEIGMEIGDIVTDHRLKVEVTLPINKEKVCLGKLNYGQIKEIQRETDRIKGTDIGILRALENGGNPKTPEWLDALLSDDFDALAAGFRSISTPLESIETWLARNHGDIYDKYLDEIGAKKPGSNPLPGSSSTPPAEEKPG